MSIASPKSIKIASPLPSATTKPYNSAGLAAPVSPLPLSRTSTRDSTKDPHHVAFPSSKNLSTLYHEKETSIGKPTSTSIFNMKPYMSSPSVFQGGKVNNDEEPMMRRSSTAQFSRGKSVEEGANGHGTLGRFTKNQRKVAKSVALGLILILAGMGVFVWAHHGSANNN